MDSMQTIILPCKYELKQAPAEPGEAPVPTKAKFRGLAYSGDVVENHGFFTKFGIDLTTMRTRPTVKILKNHDLNKELGEAKLSNDGRQVSIDDGWFYQQVAEAETVASILAQGGQYELSIGLSGKLHRFEPPEKRMLNGKMQEVEWLIKDGRVFEVSFVAAGADENTFVETLSGKLGAFYDASSHEIGADEMDKELQDQVKTLTDQLVALTATNTTLAADRDRLQAESEKAAAAARRRAVQQKFAKVGFKLADDSKELTAYSALDDATVDATVAHLKQAALTSKLTAHQAVDEGDDEPSDEGSEQGKVTEVEGVAGKFKRTGLSVAIDNRIAQQKRFAG